MYMVEMLRKYCVKQAQQNIIVKKCFLTFSRTINTNNSSFDSAMFLTKGPL